MVAYDQSYKGSSYLDSLQRYLVVLAFIGYVLITPSGIAGLGQYFWNILALVVDNCAGELGDFPQLVLHGSHEWWVAFVSLIRDPRMYGWYMLAHVFVYVVYGSKDGPILLGSVTVELSRRAYRGAILRIIQGLIHVQYLGVHPTVHIPKNDPVRHPLSMFTASLFRLFAPERHEIARATYKRVNPIAELKLEALKKFDHDLRLNVDLHDDFVRLAEESKAWEDRTFKERLNEELRQFDDFSNCPFDGSSAAGYPYKVGTKRRTVADDARYRATDLIHSMWTGSVEHLKEFVHYVTGRAKLVAPDSPDTVRLIVYQSFPTFLIMQKYAAPFTEWFVRDGPDWSAIGFSWFNGGAGKIASFFGLNSGKVPPGFFVNSSDASNWDASLSSDLIKGVCEYHKHIITRTVDDIELRKRWCMILDNMYEHMIRAECVFPGGHTFRLCSGMKSGWNLTSIDNTIIHEVIFRRVMISVYGRILPHKLYGDDNIFLSPSGIDSEKIVSGYAEFGIKIKHIHTGDNISQVDFLSKTIHFDSLSQCYYPYRETVESDARMIMPEDYDPALVPATDAVAAAEVIIGHLYDNFFNVSVRDLCLTMLTHIRDNYDVQEVDPGRAMRAYRHKGFGDAFRHILPTVPDVDAIFRLYGVPSTIETVLPSSRGYIEVPQFSIAASVSDATQAVVCEDFLRSVNLYCSRLGNRANCIVRALTRPFRVTGWTAGTGGGKLLEALKRYSINPPTLLDVGGHPGSVACSVINVLPGTHITSVSSMYAKDVKAGHPFMYKAPIRECDVRVQMNFEKYVPDRRFGHCHIDVTFDDLDMHVKYGDERSAGIWCKRVGPMIEKGLSCSKTVTVVLPSVNDSVLYMMHGFMGVLDDIDFFKPVYSHGWNTEVVAYLKKGSGIKMRYTKLRAAGRAFRTKLTERSTFWAYARMANAASVLAGQPPKRSPLHGDAQFQASLLKSITPAFGRVPRELEKFAEFDETPT